MKKNYKYKVISLSEIIEDDDREAFKDYNFSSTPYSFSEACGVASAFSLGCFTPANYSWVNAFQYKTNIERHNSIINGCYTIVRVLI